MDAENIWSVVLLSAGVGFIAGHLAGFFSGRRAGVADGYKRGQDTQWVDDQIAAAQREKARRDRNGQFKTKS